MIGEFRCLLLAIGFLLLAIPAGHTQQSFRFVALGDVPYGKPDVVSGPYRSLIAIINQKAPAFTVHLGDIKNGSSPCSDGALLEQLKLLNTFEGGLLYTPGDNEWTDCHREKAGGYDPLERLAFLRKTFFRNASRSLGGTPMVIESQAMAMNGYPDYV